MAEDTKKVLWRNVSTLMTEQWGRENLTRLSAKAKIGEASVHRMKAAKTSIGLDQLIAVGKVFKRAPWQLLDPRPGMLAFSDEAAKIAALFDSLDEDKQAAAYALILQILDFGRIVPTPPGSPTLAPAPSPAETPRTRHAEAPAAPAPTRARRTSR